MSVIVTTTFAHGAVFYAGETVSCTIAFTNPLPLPPNPPSATSSSSSSYKRRSLTRHYPTQPNSLQHHGSHNRSQSLTSTLEFNGSRVPQRDRRIANGSRETEGATLASNGRSLTTHSLSSLASSTISFFTGNKSAVTKHSLLGSDREEKGSRVHEQFHVQSTANGDPISVELSEEATPRSSMETTASYSKRDMYIDGNGRNSMDSVVSNQHYPTRHPQLTSPRLSQILLRSTSAPALAKKPERLLWGFAQVVGNFIVDPNLINNNEFAPLKQRTMYRPHGAGIGGGGMLMGQADAHAKMDNRTAPVISTPPSILFVDLDLAPGETKKFSYKLKIPNDIPPSHRGKTIRFSYSLVVGTQRSNGSVPGSATALQGQVVQIPFRVLNHVSEDGSQPVYDLMNPVVMYKDEAVVEAFSDEDFKRPRLNMKRPTNKEASEKARSDFLDYVNELMEHNNDNESVHEITRRESDAYDEPTDEQAEDADTVQDRMLGRTCAQIVSKLTNTSRKAMFDICKNNQRVAKLHLIKTSYRLGEPVIGVLDFEQATLSTYQVSILLESNEVVEPSIALRQPQRIARFTKKCYAEHHSFCLSHRRLPFSLPIPAIASPDFQTTGVSLKYHLKFEFVVSQNAATANVPQSFLPINTDERHRHYQSIQDVDVSIFDCQIPIRVYGFPGSADRAVFGRPYTFAVQ